MFANRRSLPQTPAHTSNCQSLPGFAWKHCILLLAAISITPPVTWGQDTVRPNIVVILADDLGYGDAQPLNPESTIPTPNLNQLAADGMTFTDAHSPSAVCTPTRYGVLLGRYSWRSRLKSGVLGGYSPPLIELQQTTLPEMLRSRGYRTLAVGKWHLGMSLPMLEEGANNVEKWDGDPGVDFAGTITNGPTHHGFDHYFGVSASLDMAPYVYVEDDHFASLPTEQQKARPFPDFVRTGPKSADFEIDTVLDRLTDKACGWIEESAKLDQPFFLYFPLTAPHKPTTPAERFRGRSGLGPYGDFIMQTDAAVGRVLETLETAGITDQTLVVLTSDNGSYMFRLGQDAEDHVEVANVQGFRPEHHQANGEFRGTKADIFEAGHRVPFFVKWPGKIQPGSKCNNTICHTDLFATLAEITGARLEQEVAEDSVSLWPMWQDPTLTREVPVVHHSVAGMFAIRQDEWKLILGNGSGGRQAPRGKPFEMPYQLFNLANDPQETTNLIDSNPEIVDQLLQRFETLREQGHAATRSRDWTPSDN